MKKLLLFILSNFLFLPVKAQVVFFPPGAEWRYAFMGQWGPRGLNIHYIHDSIVESETVKIIKYDSFFKNILDSSPDIILIKQHGDTIFMKNRNTLNVWQILYNFATPPGQSWTTTVRDISSSSQQTVALTHTISVNSTGTVAINNVTLKTMTISISYQLPGSSAHSDNIQVIERIGSTPYLFDYYNQPSSDSDYYYLTDFLCYTDNTFGSASFSQKGCNYDVGISENAFTNDKIKIYPQPVNNRLMLELSEVNASKSYEVQITDMFGQAVLSFKEKISNSKAELDLETLQNGIYILRLLENNKPIAIRKVIKQGQ